MGRKSSISRLPAEIKTYIEAMLATGAQTLDEMIADLQDRFPAEARAGDLPSRTALHRYGSKLDRRLAAIKASTEAAMMIRQHAGDSQDARSEALTALVQTELFEAILELQEADDPNLDQGQRVAMLSAAAKNIATLSRSSVNLKKFQAEIEARTRKQALEDATQEAETAARKQGLSPDSVAALREAIMRKL